MRRDLRLISSRGKDDSYIQRYMEREKKRNIHLSIGDIDSIYRFRKLPSAITETIDSCTVGLTGQRPEAVYCNNNMTCHERVRDMR